MPSVTEERARAAGSPGPASSRRGSGGRRSSRRAPAGSARPSAGSSALTRPAGASTPSLIGGPFSLLGRYTALDGTQPREILALSAPDASTLVIDCSARTRGDALLVARIAPEEPRENAQIVCELYLADESRGRCRRLSAEDLDLACAPSAQPRGECAAHHDTPLIDGEGGTYRIRILAADTRSPELRWTRTRPGAPEDLFVPVTLREVIARLQDYEPAQSITIAALAAHAKRDTVSTCALRCELQRVQCSPIVLNRGLREAVQRQLAHGVTMSQIAIRCGRLKRDRRGTLSGETSWLARRIGQMPEAGRAEPTPWVHSSTLALIAREGLGVNPNEVEL
jgi:hypothetical protein